MALYPPSAEAERNSRRIRFGTLLASLVIHLGLVALLLHAARPTARGPARATTTEIELQEIEAPSASAPEAAAKSQRTAVKRHDSGNRVAGGGIARISGSRSAPGAGSEKHQTEDVVVGDVPRALDLSLHAPLETASPGGETVHNRPGEIEPPGVRGSLAQERITELFNEDSASRRVDEGLVDDWFARLGTSLDRALNNPAPAPVGLGGVWAIIDISYDLGGKLKSSRVVDSSGNRDFNFHVLNVVAVRLPGLPDLPDGGGEGIHPDGTHSVWRVTGHLSFTRDVRKMTANDAWYVPLAAAPSILAGIPFDETTGFVGYQDFRKPVTKCAVELLKVY